MRNISFIISLILAFLSYLSASGQVRDTVALTPDFRFNDGIYLNFSQVKENSPIPKAKILTSANYNDRDFFDKVLESDNIFFYDALGGRQEVDKNDIWGYSRNGVLYVRVEDSFNRITYVGNFCHFVADITTYDRRYNNYPYNTPNPYFNNYYPSYYNPYGSQYGYGYPYNQNSITRKELVQYIIDMEDGRAVEFDIKNVEILLLKDPELYQEFMMLSRKNKKQMLFLFIRKFNEKHPIYLPK